MVESNGKYKPGQGAEHQDGPVHHVWLLRGDQRVRWVCGWIYRAGVGFEHGKNGKCQSNGNCQFEWEMPVWMKSANLYANRCHAICNRLISPQWWFTLLSVEFALFEGTPGLVISFPCIIILEQHYDQFPFFPFSHLKSILRRNIGPVYSLEEARWKKT